MRDLRDGLRALLRAPLVSAVAILSLGLGIGANTAIFSIFDTLLLKSLPVREPQSLVAIVEEGEAQSSWTNAIWEQIRDRSELFDGAFAWFSTRFDLSLGGEAEFVAGVWASGSFFDVLGVAPILGRTFVADDDRRGGGEEGAVAVISYSFWQRRFGGALDVIGRTLTLERVPYEIIGVTPPDFFGVEVGESFDVVVPIGTEPLVRGDESRLDRRSLWWLQLAARLKPGQTPESLTAALRGVQNQVREATLPDDWQPEELVGYLKAPLTATPIATGTSVLRRGYRRPLTAILIVVALVLMIACANIANLQLARATARRHDLSVRLALGASRLRLARQLVVESLLLSSLGAALGLLFASWGGRLLLQQLSAGRGTRLFLDLETDARVLLFTMAVAVGTAVLFGTAPAFHAARVEPSEALQEQGRGVTGPRRSLLRHGLVVTQVALSLILVAAAGLFLQTFSSLITLDPGFDREAVLVMEINAQRSSVEAAGRPELFERVRQEAAAVPGVSAAAASVVTPVSGMIWNTVIELEGGPQLSERERAVHMNQISPGWLTTLGTPLLAGRDLDDRDKRGGPKTAIVNEAFARRFQISGSPLGRTIILPGRPGRPRQRVEIVGFCQDAVYSSLREAVPPTMYFAIAQAEHLPPFASISVRAQGNRPTAGLARSLAEAVSLVDKDLSLTFQPLEDLVSASLVRERVVATLSAFFGGLALLLAGLGLYGVTCYSVNRRRYEIGVRMALGASPSRVAWMVLRGVTWLVGLGTLGGTLAGLWMAGFAEKLLYGLAPRDPATFAGAAALLFLVGAAASWVPARRASHIDPARVLRDV